MGLIKHFTILKVALEKKKERKMTTGLDCLPKHGGSTGSSSVLVIQSNLISHSLWRRLDPYLLTTYIVTLHTKSFKLPRAATTVKCC